MNMNDNDSQEMGKEAARLLKQWIDATNSVSKALKTFLQAGLNNDRK